MKCYASDVIEIAKSEVGYLEKKSNSKLDSKTDNAGYNNYTKYANYFDKEYPDFYNGKKNGYAWCDVFIDYIFVQAFGKEKGRTIIFQPLKSCGAGCYYSRQYYKDNGRLFDEPKAGDQIFFYNSSKSGIAHTGLVYKVDKTKVYTIEGNTSSASGVEANGGSVEMKSYLLSYSRIAGYGRPAYDEEKTTKTTDKKKTKTNKSVLEWQKAAIKDGFKFPKYGADGQWGKECEEVAKKAICKKRLIGYKYKNLTKIVQKTVGVTADGKFGKDTKNAVIKYQKLLKLVADGEVGINTWKKILGI